MLTSDRAMSAAASARLTFAARAGASIGTAGFERHDTRTPP